MSLNWKEINLILEELSLEGAFIQKVIQPDFRNLLFHIFNPESGRYRLLISFDQGACRLHRITGASPKKEEKKLQRFAQFLRARIQGGRVISCSQIGEERTVSLEITKGGELTRLYIRLWGNAGNIVAADQQDQILDAFFRRPGRGEISGGEFTPPVPHSGSLRQFAIRKRDESLDFNRQIEIEYSQRNSSSRIGDLQEKTRILLEGQEAAVTGKIDSLKARLEGASHYEDLRETGDLLAANRHLIRQGESWVEVEDYRTSEMVRIALTPTLSPGENIERYYTLYRKAKGAEAHISDELALAEGRLKALQERRKRLLRPLDDEEELLNELEQFIKEQGKQQVKKLTGKGEGPPGLQFQSGPYTIFVGRAAAENDRLLRSYMRGNDYWLHTRDFPGGYVFIKSIKGKTVPLETLLDAGNLALYYSKGRSNGKGELYYTQVKYLRRAKNGPLGLVLPTQEKNLSITLDQKRLDKLFTSP